jgi:hypothetical protein
VETTGRPEHLFVVRLWQEPSRAAPPGQWRGSAEHVSSGQRDYFVTLEELNQFILAQLQIAALESPKPS